MSIFHFLGFPFSILDKWGHSKSLISSGGGEPSFGGWGGGWGGGGGWGFGVMVHKSLKSEVR